MRNYQPKGLLNQWFLEVNEIKILLKGTQKDMIIWGFFGSFSIPGVT